MNPPNPPPSPPRNNNNNNNDNELPNNNPPVPPLASFEDRRREMRGHQIQCLRRIGNKIMGLSELHPLYPFLTPLTIMQPNYFRQEAYRLMWFLLDMYTMALFVNIPATYRFLCLSDTKPQLAHWRRFWSWFKSIDEWKEELKDLGGGGMCQLQYGILLVRKTYYTQPVHVKAEWIHFSIHQVQHDIKWRPAEYIWLRGRLAQENGQAGNEALRPLIVEGPYEYIPESIVQANDHAVYDAEERLGLRGRRRQRGSSASSGTDSGNGTSPDRSPDASSSTAASSPSSESTHVSSTEVVYSDSTTSYTF